ncbi:GNAT family N-acetyltransferase [Longispora urticae]
MDIRRLDPHDENTASAWYEAFRAGGVALREAPTFFAADAVLGSLRTNDTRHAYGAWSGDVCLGAALLDLPARANTHMAELELNVPPAYRGRGVGAALFDTMVRAAAEAGRSRLSTELNVPRANTLESYPGGRFALARGLRSVLSEQRYLVDLPVDDADLAALAGRAAPGYTVESWAGPVGRERAAVFARLRTLMEQDVPTGERDHEPDTFDADRVLAGDAKTAAQGWGLLTTLVLDADGTPARYTRIFVNADGVHAQQDDTFVLRAHRGHRLGVLAKVANMRQLAALHPGVRHLHSWTADTNDAMLAINARFGFRAVEAMHVLEGELPAS